MIPFSSASYRAQVSRLRKLAVKALKLFPIRVAKLRFIHYGENATFQVTSPSGEKFLLRVQRPDYHTTEGTLEELRWLERLEKIGITAPRPLRSKKNRLIEFAETDAVSKRPVCVFRWVEGRFVRKSITAKNMEALGGLIADLQRTGPRLTKARRYWDTDGLVGKTPKFGRVENLLTVSPAHQKQILKSRPRVYAKLKNFEKRFPERMGVIHADLHFGNLVRTKNGLAPIDFDDSGFGFHVYDLVIPLLSAQLSLGPKRKKEYEKLKTSLIRGYSSKARWDQHDEEMLLHLSAARRIAILGWINDRADNPRLLKYLKGSAKRTAAFLKKHYG